MNLIGLIVLLQLCTSWADGVQTGELPEAIDEASGAGFSTRYPGRMYHVNDSGDSGRFFITDAQGGSLQEVRISGFDPVDVEALAVGPCGAAGTCVFVADVGDNSRRRASVEIVLIAEEAQFPATVTPYKRLRIRYPDGSSDAEAMAVHPDGTILVLSKESASGLSRLYKLPAAKWQNGSGVLEMERAGAIDFRRIFPGGTGLGRSATAMDVSADGRRLLVLTYRDAVEFALDLAQSQAVANATPIRLQPLQQQEAVAYVPGEHAFVYTTEQFFFRAFIMKMSCRLQP